MIRGSLTCVLIVGVMSSVLFADTPTKLPVVESDPPPPGALIRLGGSRLRLPESPWHLAFSPDDSYLAVRMYAETRVWEAKTWKEVWRIPSTACSFDPDGRHIAVHGDDNAITIWDIREKKKIVTRDLGKHSKDIQIQGIEFAPNGNRIWINNRSAGLDLFDWKNDKIVRTIKYDGLLGRGFTQSRDGKRVAIDHDNNKVVIWNAETSKLIRTIIRPDDRWLVSCALSRDGKFIALDDFRDCIVYEVESGREIEMLPSFGRTSLIFEPVRDVLIAGNARIDLKTKNIQPGIFEFVANRISCGGRFTYNAKTSVALSFTANGKIAALSQLDGCVQILDGETFKPILDDPHPRGAATRVAFSPSGDSVATMHEDLKPSESATVRLWNLNEGGAVAKSVTITNRADLIPLDSAGRRSPKGAVANYEWRSDSEETAPLSFSSDGRRVLVGGFLDWELATGKQRTGSQLRPTVPEGRALAINEDGSRWVVVKHDKGNDRVEELFLFDSAAAKKLRKLPLPNQAETRLMIIDCRAALSADAKTIAFTTSAIPIRDGRMREFEQRFPDNGHLVVWNAKAPDKSLVLRLPTANDPANSDFHAFERSHVAITRDGRMVACAIREFGYPEVVHAASGFPLWKPEIAREVEAKGDGPSPLDGSAANLVAFSTDGHLLACARFANQKAIIVRESLTGETAQTIPGDNGVINQIVFSPDGSLLAAAADDGTTTLWKVSPFGSAKPGRWKALDAEANWKALLEKAPAAFQAMADFRAGGDEAIVFLGKPLRDRMTKVAELAARTPKLVDDLGSPVFRVREGASVQLAKEGFRVKPYLTEALAKATELEQQRRLQVLVGHFRTSGLEAEEVRVCRAIVVLERIGTPAAVAVLESLTRGHPDGIETQTARSAVDRLRESTKR